jgi:hypothetical protein
LEWFGASGAIAAGIATAVGIAAAWPALVYASTYGPATLAWLDGRAPARDPLLDTISGSLIRFAQQVRAATPETSSYLVPAEPPAYGIATAANFGHTLRHYARRPVPIDNFWDKFPIFDRLQNLGELEDEAEVAGLLTELRLRYLLTTGGRGDDESVVGRLSGTDGAAVAGRAPLTRFRLVTEGPAGGRRLDCARARCRTSSSREVAGAVLEVPAAPGSEVEARIELVTPAERRMRFAVTGRAAPDGIARLRVPYASDTATPVRASGPWTVETGGTTRSAVVTDAQVEDGATVVVR